MGRLARAWRGLWGKRIDPRALHAYQPVDESALIAAASSQSNDRGGGPSAAMLAVMADASRGRCRLPGCGKPPDDPIHQ